MLPKVKLDFSRARVLISARSEREGFREAAKLNSAIILLSLLPFSTQLSTQSLTVDSSETYF